MRKAAKAIQALTSSVILAVCYLAASAGLIALPALADAEIDKPAPDFSLSDADGKAVKLSDFRGNKVVVVYFYPKDDVGVCKAEACSFRDSYEKLKSAGAEVIGISSDSVKSHKKFVEHRKLPFILLSDPKGAVRKEWGVPTVMGVLPGRVTYVVDKEGIVRLKVNSMLDADRHVDEALKEVNKLAAK